MNSSASSSSAQPAGQRRARLLKTLYQWHWISASLSLALLVLYAVTGITLNNAAWIEAQPQVVTREAQLPPQLQTLLSNWDAHKPARGENLELPRAVSAWLEEHLAADVQQRDIDWSPDEVYINLPRPGGDGWLRIDRTSGEIEYETTTRGWIAYLNDLHKGRHTGIVWSWLIDIFAGACLLFGLTGLYILKMHAANRALTWPLFGLGIVLPAVLALVFIH